MTQLSTPYGTAAATAAVTNAARKPATMTITQSALSRDDRDRSAHSAIHCTCRKTAAAEAPHLMHPTQPVLGGAM